jgi:hypothetical protein
VSVCSDTGSRCSRCMERLIVGRPTHRVLMMLFEMLLGSAWLVVRHTELQAV